MTEEELTNKCPSCPPNTPYSREPGTRLQSFSSSLGATVAHSNCSSLCPHSPGAKIREGQVQIIHRHGRGHNRSCLIYLYRGTARERRICPTCSRSPPSATPNALSRSTPRKSSLQPSTIIQSFCIRFSQLYEYSTVSSACIRPTGLTDFTTSYLSRPPTRAHDISLLKQASGGA
jgi:hypothetical protein